MVNIYNRLLTWFNRLTYPQKFNVIAVIFILPIIGFLPLISDQNARIDKYGRKELFGVFYLRPVWLLTEDLQNLELIHQKYVAGEVPFSEVESAQSAIDDDFERLIRLHSEYRESLPLTNEAQDIEAQWLILKSQLESADNAAIETSLSDLYRSLNELVIQVGDISYLILDPDLETYYMMDVVLLKLPENQELFFQIYQLASGTVSPQDQTQVAILVNRMQENLRAMSRDISVAVENNHSGEMELIVTEPYRGYQTSAMAYADIINAELSKIQGAENESTTRTTSMEAQYDEMRKANVAFYTAASDALEIGVVARINALVLRFYFTGLIALASTIAAFLIGQAVMDAISKPLVQLSNATQRIAKGDLSVRVEVKNKEDELGIVADAFNRMAGELEAERTALIARTRDLETASLISEKRARDLRSISEISRTISSEQSLESLLPLLTGFISAKLNYYHIGIFFVDESQRSAVLQASNSDGGRRMLQRGHQLKLGTGIVGYVAATGEPRIALDVGADSAFFNNPDLPDTLSEMALPLRVSRELIGVLDVQSIEPNAFKDDDIEVLSTLADQVSIAIQNSRSFETAQEFLEEAQRTSRSYLQDSWRALKSQNRLLGYAITGNTLKTLDSTLETIHFSKVVKGGERVVENGENANLAVPIRLAGSIVGVVNIQLPDDHEWDADEIDIAESVADRLSLALESATLLEATQKRAEIERLTADITGKIGSTTQFDSILRTAAEELSRVLGGSDVVVQIQSEALEAHPEA